MEPIWTPDTTRAVGAPTDWNAGKYGKCIKLPIVDHDGVMYSYWRPSPTERLAIFRGTPVRLAVVDIIHPPVAIDTQA